MIPVIAPVNRNRYASPSFICFHCKGEFRKRLRSGGGRRFCVDCQDRVYLARWSAHNKLYAKIKAGEMQPPTAFSCTDCGKPADRYDHRRYDRPYEVEPTCCSCNNKRGPAVLGENA